MDSFYELPLSPALQRAIKELGFEKPSPIQAQTLPILLNESTDFLGLAGTGTGKTAAFSIPLLEKLDVDEGGVQALILCPTRELVVQVSGQIDLFGKYKGIESVAVYGGSSFGDQVYGLKRGSPVVVGTPGRVVDHLDRGTLKLDSLKTIVLDEADEMMSMGFKDELEKILEQVPREQSRTWLFSATMHRNVRRVANKYLRDPKQVQVNKKEMLSKNVDQVYYVSQEANKPEILCKLMDAVEDFYGLIFCQTKALVDDLTSYLAERGYKVDSLHGDKDQRSRDRTMQAFRDRKIQALVCTDVAARGLDVKDVTHVVNYSIPHELDSYVHRIGRTARSGKSGVAISLVTPANRRLVERIEFVTKSRMRQGKIHTVQEIGRKKISRLLPRFDKAPGADRVADLLDENWQERLAGLTPTEIASRFLSLLVPDVVAEPQKTTFTGAPEERPQRPRRHDKAPHKGPCKGKGGLWKGKKAGKHARRLG